MSYSLDVVWQYHVEVVVQGDKSRQILLRRINVPCYVDAIAYPIGQQMPT